MVNDLNKAIQIACEAHQGQTDKAGKPYILHPLRLLLKFSNIDEQITAVLHDVIEDSDFTLDDLKNSEFSDSILIAVDCLTKKTNVDYSLYLEQVSRNELARKIKIEDLRDNLDLSRLNTIESKDLDRVKKYHEALKFLTRNWPNNISVRNKILFYSTVI